MVETTGDIIPPPPKTALLFRKEKNPDNPDKDSVSVEEVTLNENINDIKFVHDIIKWQAYKKEMSSLRRPAIRRYFENKFNPYITAAEVGVFQGINARSMLCYCSDMKLYLVDGYEKVVLDTHGPIMSQEDIDSIKLEAELNLAPFKNRTVWIEKQSLEAAKDFKDEFFDFVYIDGDHEYEFVKKDIQNWYPKVKKDGMIAGHDVTFQEVRKAFVEFVEENKIPPERWGMQEGDGNSDWWIFREDFPLFKNFMRSCIAFAAQRNPKVGVEVGIYEGRHSKNILTKIPGLHLYCVDNNADGAMRTARSELSVFGERATLIQKNSIEAATMFEDESLDFVYIDGDHRYLAVKEDIAAWYPKVKKEGILGGHDYNLSEENMRNMPVPFCWVNVRGAVNDFAKENKYQLYVGNTLDGNENDWWIVK